MDLGSLLTCLQDSTCLRSFVTFCNIGGFLWWGVVSYGPIPHAGGLVYVGCPRLLIHCIASCYPYLNVFSSISRDLWRAVPWWREPLNMSYLCKSQISKYLWSLEFYGMVWERRYTTIDFIFGWEFIITTQNCKFQHKSVTGVNNILEANAETILILFM